MPTTNEVATSSIITNASQGQLGTLHRKEIVYDRESRDHAMYLDGELVGIRRTYHEAEVTLDSIVFDLMAGFPFGERLR